MSKDQGSAGALRKTARKGHRAGFLMVFLQIELFPLKPLRNRFSLCILSMLHIGNPYLVWLVRCDLAGSVQEKGKGKQDTVYRKLYMSVAIYIFRLCMPLFDRLSH